MTNTFMTGHSNPKGGASTFDLFNTIGDQFWNLILFIKTQLPEDVRVYFMMHELSNDTGEVKVRTIGKLLDEKVCIEGMFTVCLHCMTNGQRHYFKTQGGSNDIAKCCKEMGDVLFSAVNTARTLDIEPEECLTAASEKFIKRFKKAEDLAEQSGKKLSEIKGEELHSLWLEAKNI